MFCTAIAVLFVGRVEQANMSTHATRNILDAAKAQETWPAPAIDPSRLSSPVTGCDEDELDATDILDAYTAQSWSEGDAVADALSRIQGAFALIIHDATEERVIAARDREV